MGLSTLNLAMIPAIPFRLFRLFPLGRLCRRYRRQRRKGFSRRNRIPRVQLRSQRSGNRAESLHMENAGGLTHLTAAMIHGNEELMAIVTEPRTAIDAAAQRIGLPLPLMHVLSSGAQRLDGGGLQ